MGWKIDWQALPVLVDFFHIEDFELLLETLFAIEKMKREAEETRQHVR